MSTRSAYHKLHRTYAPEYLFGVQISDAGQYFYESMNPAFERLLGISIQGNERAIRDCMSEEDAKSISASFDACLAEGKSVCYRQRLTLGGEVVHLVHGHKPLELQFDLRQHLGRRHRDHGDAREPPGVLGFADRERVDIVAARREQPDHPGEDARLVVDQHRERVALGLLGFGNREIGRARRQNGLRTVVELRGLEPRTF